MFFEAEGSPDVSCGSGERMARVAIALVERVAAGVLGEGDGVVSGVCCGGESRQRVATAAGYGLCGSAADGDDTLLGMLALVEPCNLGVGK